MYINYSYTATYAKILILTPLCDLTKIFLLFFSPQVTVNNDIIQNPLTLQPAKRLVRIEIQNLRTACDKVLRDFICRTLWGRAMVDRYGAIVEW
jgi:hypothetical protein